MSSPTGFILRHFVELFVLSIVVTCGIIGYWQGGRRRAWHNVFISGGIIIGLIVAFYAVVAYKLRQQFAIHTSALASPSEVHFLQLPATASHIGFYQNGAYDFAEFNVAEGELQKIFPAFTFQEISEPVTIQTNRFGDPKMPPRFYRPADPEIIAPNEPQPITITNGLFYLQQFSNNGGYIIYYDRPRSRIYYSYSSH